MTEHTDGPWRVFASGKTIEVQSQQSDVPIVNWQGFDDCARSLAEHSANALLIASAPDLEAENANLRATLERLTAMIAERDGEQFEDWDDESDAFRE